jgi:hypothetical protein
MKELIFAPLLILLSSFSRVLAVLILTVPCVQRGGETSTMAHPHCVYEPSPFGVKFAGCRHIFTWHVDVH